MARDASRDRAAVRKLYRYFAKKGRARTGRPKASRVAETGAGLGTQAEGGRSDPRRQSTGPLVGLGTRMRTMPVASPVAQVRFGGTSPVAQVLISERRDDELSLRQWANLQQVDLCHFGQRFVQLDNDL